jgi:hypothetical protein
MKRSAATLLLCTLFSGYALASEGDAWAGAEAPSCHFLLAPPECRAHRDLLARLPEGAEREAYLARHFAMLEERARSCACSMAQNGVGLLRYR